MSVMSKEENNRLTVDEVRVVCEYPKVFLKELLGMPPKREVEFTIDLTPGSTPISRASYGMTPKEL